MSKVTSRLFKTLISSDNVHEVISRDLQEHELPLLSQYLQTLFESRNIVPANVFLCIGLERTSGMKLLHGNRRSGRNVLVRIAIYLGMSMNDAQYMLRVGEKAQLDPRVRRDAAIIFALSHKYTLSEAESLLESLGERSLYEKT